MELYALHKQAISGDAPHQMLASATQAERSKWNAWKAKRGLSQTEAMRLYLQESDRQIRVYGNGNNNNNNTSSIQTPQNTPNDQNQHNEIVKTELTHKNNAGMQGFAFNTRRDKFKDVRVRRALSLAYDFEWANDKLFYNQYVRADSYFSNSELAAQGVPEGEELALLERYRDQLPEQLFTQQWQPATTVAPHSLRKNLIQARDLLAEAGWTIQDGVLKNNKGEPFRLDILLVQGGFDRIIAPYAHNLKKLGIETSYRKVDSSLYKRRLDSFEFDMVVTSFPSSVSPGNELMNMFYSSSAEIKGSRNLPAITSPVVDALVQEIIQAKDREHVVIASRALDRVLLYGEYLVPNWYINVHRVAYWNKFGIPETLPLYYDPISWLLKAWWVKDSDKGVVQNDKEI